MRARRPCLPWRGVRPPPHAGRGRGARRGRLGAGPEGRLGETQDDHVQLEGQPVVPVELVEVDRGQVQRRHDRSPAGCVLIRVGGASAGKSKKQNANFDLPLSDSVWGKSTVDDLTVAVVQMIAAGTHESGAVTCDAHRTNSAGQRSWRRWTCPRSTSTSSTRTTGCPPNPRRPASARRAHHP